jgi:anti-anti-sigma regulatory factor
MEIKEELHVTEETAVVVISGEYDDERAAEFWNRVYNLRKVRNVVLELADMKTTELGEMQLANLCDYAAKSIRPGLRFLNIPPRIKMLLVLNDFNQVFTYFTDKAKAIGQGE